MRGRTFLSSEKGRLPFLDWSDFVKFAKINLSMTPASKIYPALTLEVMVSRKEGQYYDVKSAQKKPSEQASLVRMPTQGEWK